MTTVEDANTQLSQARERTQEARSQLATEKATTQAAQQQLQSAQSQFSTARSLRSTQGGINAQLARRRNIDTIQNQLKNVGTRQEALGQYEQEILNAEANIADYQSQIDDIQAFESAKKLVADRVPVTFIENDAERKYADTLYERGYDPYGDYAQRSALIGDIVADLQAQGVDQKTLKSVNRELFSNLGKISSTQLNSNINSLVNPGIQGTQTRLEVPTVEAPPIEEISYFQSDPFSIPIVSAKSINASNSNIRNDGNVFTGLVVGDNLEQRNNDSFISRIFGNRADLEKGFQKATGQESFVSAIGPAGAFVSEPLAGQQGTATIRIPTIDEAARIQAADLRGEFFNRPVSEIVNVGQQYNDLIKGFDRLSLQEQQGRIGQLQAIGARIDPNTNQIVPPSVLVGLGSNKREVLITELDTRNPLRTYRSALSYLGGRAAAQTARGFGLDEEGIITIPEYTAQVPASSILTRGTRQDDLLSPSTIFTGVTVEAQPLGTPSQIQSAVRTGIDVGPYFIPGVGQSLFLGESVYDIGSEINKSGSKGIIDFVTKFPIETVALGGLGALKIGKVFTPQYSLVRATRNTPGVKPNIFINPTETKSFFGPDGTKLTRMSFDIFGKAKKGSVASTVELRKSSPIRDFFGVAPKTIYESARGRKDYRDAYNKLIELGVNKKEVRGLLRQYSKSGANVEITGKGNVLLGDGIKPSFLISSDAKFVPRVQIMPYGKRTRKFNPFKERGEQAGKTLGNSDNAEFYGSTPDITKLYFKSGSPSREFQKLSQAGRTTRRSAQLSKVTRRGNVELDFPIGNNRKVAVPFEFSTEVSKSQSIIPKRRVTTRGTANIFVTNLPDSVTASSLGVRSTGRGQSLLSKQRTSTSITKNQLGRQIGSMVPKPSIKSPRAPRSKTINLVTQTSTGVLPLLTKRARNLSGRSATVTESSSQQILAPRTRQSNVSRQDNIVKQNPRVRVDLGTALRFRSSQSQVPRQSPFVAQSPRNIPRQQTGQRTPQDTRQRQRSAQRSAQANLLGGGRPRPRNETGRRTTTTGKVFFADDSFRRRRPRSFSAGPQGNRFIGLVRRRGKFQAVSGPTSFDKALGIGKGRATSTLGASVGVLDTATGRRVVLQSDRNFGFGSSGRDPFTIVQRKTQRLGSRSERNEIVSSRRSGGFFL